MSAVRQHLLACLLGCLLATGLAVAVPASAHAADRDCSDFASQRAAQLFFLAHGGPRSDPHRLDSDDDGVVCESNPGPYYYGTTPPPPPSQPAPAAVASRVVVSLSRGAAIAGEPVVVRAAVAPRTVRTVTFQRWSGNRWVRLATRKTTRAGAVALRTRAPRATTRYRAVVAARTVGRKRYSAATSAGRVLRVQRQSVGLRLSRYQVAELGVVTATVRTLPVRVGRPVALQVRRSDGWRTLATKRMTRSGQLAFALRAGTAGVRQYRALAASFGGAAAAVSVTRALTAEDVTGPARPTGLVATPDDGAVVLTWDAPGDDATGYDVYQRLSGAVPWAFVGTTSAWTSTVSGLTNGTSYDFSLVARDRWGNSSARSAVVSATPQDLLVP